MGIPATETPFSVVYSSSLISSKFQFYYKSLTSVRLHIVPRAKSASLKLPIQFPIRTARRRSGFRLHSAVETAAIEEKIEKIQQSDSRRKLVVLNLPWSFSVVDIKNLFGECGSAADVEIIKRKDGKSKGFAFVTMSTGEEARAAIEKFDSYEVSGRIIKVEFSKSFKGPTPAPPPSPLGETRHRLYASNLAWKVRSNSLREFFSTSCNPISARVVFDSQSGKSAGYGFVSFTTKEEAESAISLLDGKELLGRPIRLKLSEKNTESPESKEESMEEQPESL